MTSSADASLEDRPSWPAEQLAEVVERAGQVVLLDVFDTLLERTIRPEHVKILACDRLVRLLGLRGLDGLSLYARRSKAEREISRQNLADHGEVEFHIAQLAGMLHAELSASGHLPEGIAPDAFLAAVLRAELAVERCCLRLKPGALPALAAARRTARRVLLVSDHYLPGEQLGRLFADIGLGTDLYETLIVSSDHRASKRSGRLFDLLLARLGCPAAELTMIGDNPHSDIAMARSRGLRAVLVADPARTDFYASAAAEVTRFAALETRMQALIEGADAPSQHLRHAVPALLLFIERLFVAARERGLRHLFFLSREGQVLRRLFEIYQDAFLGDGPDRITTHYLLASRRACFPPSLDMLGRERFAGLFDHYRRISMRDFCRSIGLEDAATDRFAASLGLDPDVVEQDFPTSDAFQALCTHQDFAALYEARRITQRANLLDYLGQFGVDLRRHPLAIVDCGWKGSIQDFLRSALPPEIAIEGFYLGLIGVGQSLEHKHGLLLSTVGARSPDYAIYAENRSLFEVLLCADHGSALSYDRRDDGSVAVTVADDEPERDFVERKALPVARDAEAVFRELVALRTMSAVPASAWERAVAAIHARLVFRPWRPEAAWLRDARHREGFGVFHMSSFHAGSAPSLAERARFLLTLARRPGPALSAAFWPAAMLHAHGGRLLVHGYALWRRSHAALRRRGGSVSAE